MKFNIALIASLASFAVAAPAPANGQLVGKDTDKVLVSGGGDGTYYDTGLGACGYENSDDQWVVALAPADYAGGARCGDAISIWYGGKQIWAQVVDLCTGCGTGSIDMTPSLFSQFASTSVGRLHGVTWYINA